MRTIHSKLYLTGGYLLYFAGFLGRLFQKWFDQGMLIRLDVWHWLQRFSGGLTSPSAHDLNEQFWVEMSCAVFTSDINDAKHLKEVCNVHVFFVSSNLGPLHAFCRL